jgi:1-acyl-sn-glycerol-3-phosphate acyltransferase
MKKFLRWLIHTVLKLITKIEPSGYENLPEKGGFVIAVNHLGILDVPMAFYALDNWNLFIPVGEKWGEIPILKWLGKYLNLIYIDRFNPDLKSMREMIKRMDEGQTLVIAPEGTRARDEKMAQGNLALLIWLQKWIGRSCLSRSLGQKTASFAGTLSGFAERI